MKDHSHSSRRPPRPLAGFRVLDLTNVLAGPYCGHLLAQLGADVVKIESPGGGDLARKLGASPEMSRNLMGASFVAQNAGKRSLALNLKSERDASVFRRLAGRADALVENFRPGVMARLGFGWNELKRQNPRLVYCAISGFGQDGEFAGAPAYDQILQGMSGLMSVTGDSASAPLRTGFPAADAVGGLTAAFAVAAALAGREKKTGKSGRADGCFIDVSMLESLLSAMGWVVSNCLAVGEAPQPRGNDNPTASPSGTFAAADGPLNIAANKRQQFEALCDLLGRAELKTDARFAERESRLAHRAELTRELEASLSQKPAGEWAAKMRAAGVPAGEILNVAQALALPQIAERGFIAEFPTPGGRTLRAARVGFRINGETPHADSPPPELNRHAAEILSELESGPDSADAGARSGGGK